ncbi:MAG: response regulator transcription factor, partial [Planctomycetota bacterium]
LEDLRASGNVTPVIFVTASEGVENRVRGLRSGADDYIIKPFSPEELIARIEAVDRRQHVLPVIQVADLSVDMGRRTAERGGTRIDISPREYDLLVALLEARGATCSRAELLDKVWGIQEDTGTNVVEVQVARLRRKIDKGQTPLIHTVTGIGYRLTDQPKNDVQRVQ